MKIPFVDLHAQYQSIRERIYESFFGTFSEGCFINGAAVGQFENAFASAVGRRHVIGTANGTDSLFIALKAANVGPGSEVIVPAWGHVSAAETVSLAGGKPIFADVDPVYYTLDPAAVISKTNKNTRAVIAVHLYGQAADVATLREFCRDQDLVLIEDCAQAHLAELDQQIVGGFGDLGAFSFYPTKNLGAYGDAGCVVTDNDRIAEHARRLSNHGALKRDDHTLEGVNSRIDTLQAAFLLAKLPFLNSWTQKRIENAGVYAEQLAGLEYIKLPEVRPQSKHVFHIFAVRAKRRDALRNYLLTHRIETMIHYPKALINLPAYHNSTLTHSGQFPVANILEEEILSLPIYPEIKREQILMVCNKIRSFYKS